jgi:glycerophosphoryl diester phosphodiesterase
MTRVDRGRFLIVGALHAAPRPISVLCLLIGCTVFFICSQTQAIGNLKIIHTPAVIGHRGGRKWAPENTLAAFRKCLDAEIDGIELDVQRCKTGELIVIHDDTVKRTTNGSGSVDQMSYEEIEKLDAGNWFSPEFKGEKVPTLKSVLDLVDGRLLVNVEIKNAPVRYPGIEEDVIHTLDQYEFPDKIMISSFDHEVLRAIHDRTAKYKLALLTVGTPYDLNSYAKTVGAKAWNPSFSELREDSVKRAEGDGIEVNVWTVNSQNDWRRAADMGVTSIITDDPLGLIEYLKVRTTAMSL